MPGFPKSRPPANRVALERWINQKAQDDGVAANRLRRAVSFTAGASSADGRSGPVLPHQGRRDVVPSLDRLGQRAHDIRRASSGGAMTTSSVVARVSPT
jgi:hypothetical protein